MPSPKSGNAGQAVTPAGPESPFEADKADPGEMTEVKARQKETQTGKYGSPSVEPHKPSKKDEEKKPSWIEIEMVGEDDKPIVGEAYRIKLPEGSVVEGTLDDKGFARVDGIEPGNCQITFPNLDCEAWERA